MTVSYDGSGYSGYQKQSGFRTIQSELERAITEINNNKPVEIYSSGRTDKGVHAINQKIHFDLNMDISLYNLREAINSKIPDDIYVKSIEEVDEDFHARYSVIAKEYIYIINLGEFNPIERNYVYQYNKPLDLVNMERALQYFVGEHDFSSFTKPDDSKKNFVRNIRIVNLKKHDNDKVTITFVGNGFLRYMVRNMVGTIIEVGEGKRKSEDLYDIISSKDRTKAGIMAPACGLYLKDVYY